MCGCNVYVRRGRTAYRAGFDSLPATLCFNEHIPLKYKVFKWTAAWRLVVSPILTGSFKLTDDLFYRKYS
jgi:hypothetical protein